LIEFDIQKESLDHMLDSLGKKTTKEVLRRSINDTAKYARKNLQDEATKTYAIKKGSFNKAMGMKKATYSNLEAVITASGHPNELKSFKVSPASYSTGEDRPSIVKAKVLNKSRMKGLQTGDIKAFIVKFKSGHVTIAQRVRSKRLPVRVLYSPSIPVMLGNENRVYGKIQPDVYKYLQDKIKVYTDQALEGRL